MSPTSAHRWLALTGLLVAEAMNLLDATIVQVAAPVIHTDLTGQDSDVQWFSAAYTLPLAMVLITGGRLGDLYGRKRIFTIGVIGFVLASAVCALSISDAMLIATRAVQGAAAGLIIPQTFGLIRGMFDGPELPKALGFIGPVMGLAAVCGPIIGGVLTHADLFGSSWRSVFLVNVPLGIAVLVIARALREDRAPDPGRLDLIGTALAMLGAGLVIYPLITGTWSASTWMLLAAGVVVLVSFAGHQRGHARRGRDSLIAVSLFGSRGFVAALCCLTLFFAVLNGLTLVIVLQLQLVSHADVLTASLTLVPWSVGMGVSAMLAGSYLYPRHGANIVFAGLGLLFAGIIAAVVVDAAIAPTGYPWPLLGALGVAGLGIGLFTTPLFTLALRNVRPHETGSAAGLLNAFQELGATLGVAVLGTVFLSTVGLAGPRHALFVAAGLVALTVIGAAIMVDGARRRSGDAQSVGEDSVEPVSALSE
ncbi:MAG TPA: MFS transporter [Pseudonocardiaceae bacterium]